MENITLIGLTGKKGSGKDTLGNYMVSHYGFNRIAFADPIKIICKELFGFNEDQLNGNLKEKIDEYWNVTPRFTFQKLGDIMRDNGKKLVPELDNNIFVECIKKKIIDLRQNNPNIKIVVTDVRFENELKLIKDLGGIIIKIDRNIETNDTHQSETEMERFIPDIIFSNNGNFENLYEQFNLSFV